MRARIAIFAVLAFQLAVPASHADTETACNVTVDVTDTDPHGTNVRTAPGGAVIASLTNPNVEGWVQVHITGQTGDWYKIDRAALINADVGPEGKMLFHGKGYLHKSMLGVSGMENDGAIYTDHDRRSRPVDLHAPGDQKVEMLGCWNDYLKVRVRKGTGWTTQACTNMDTTCS